MWEPPLLAYSGFEQGLGKPARTPPLEEEVVAGALNKVEGRVKSVHSLVCLPSACWLPYGAA